MFVEKPPPSLATVSEFDASCSGHIGRMPSKLALETLSDASKSGRVSRMLSDASRSGRMGRMLSDTSKSGITGRAMPSSSALGDNSCKGETWRPPVVGKPAVVRLFGGEINNKDNLGGSVALRGEAKETSAPNDERV